MPRSGSGGSHFSGGGHSGGSHFGGGSHYSRGGSGFYTNVAPMRIHFHGGYYVMSSGKSAIIYILIFLTFFLGVLGVTFTANNYKTEIDAIKSDYVIYYNMVEGLGETSVQKTAHRTGFKYNALYKKYYFTYYILLDNNTTRVDFDTYCLFDADDINHYGNTFEVAVINSNDYDTVDSTPLDIINYKVEDDAEYQYFVRKNKSNTIIGIAVLCGGVVCLATIVVCAKKFFKKEEEKTESATTSENAIEEKQDYCKYCGGIIEKGEKHCPSCGARINKND